MGDREVFQIEDSILKWDYSYPFEFIFNDHFSRDVNLHTFNYKPYVLNFLFGVFSILKPTKPKQQELRLTHKFHLPSTDNVARWLLVFIEDGHISARFVNFYLDDSYLKTDWQDPLIAIDDSMYVLIKSNIVYLDVYVMSHIPDASGNLKLIATKLNLGRMTLPYTQGQVNWHKSPDIDTLLGTTIKNFLLNPKKRTAFLLFKTGENVLKPLNQSLFNGKDSSMVFGFIHGVLFAKKSFNNHIVIHHHQTGNINSFYLTVNPSEPFTLSFLSDAAESNFIKSISYRDLTCSAYQKMRIFSYTFGAPLLDKCNLDGKSDFYKNGLDYLTNLLEYSKSVTEEKLKTGDFEEYLGNIFEKIRPTNVKYDETSNSYLRFFIMGTLISSMVNSHSAMIHTYEDIFIFRPNNPAYPFVIISVNIDYKRITQHGLVEKYSKNPSTILWVNIDEYSSSNDLLSKKFIRREIQMKLLTMEQISENRGVFSQWAKLKQSMLLTNLLHANQSLNYFIETMENAFDLLYDIDYRYSFHPFMHGLFYSSAFAESLGQGRVLFLKYKSRWTHNLQIYHQTRGWRNFFIYFLPNFEETTQFINSIGERPMKGTNATHIILMYNEMNRTLNTAMVQANRISQVVSFIGKIACTTYTVWDGRLCNPPESVHESYRLQTARMYFSMPKAIIRHLKILGLGGETSRMHYRHPLHRQSSVYEAWSMQKSKSIEPANKIKDLYTVGHNLKKLIIDPEKINSNNYIGSNILTVIKGEAGITSYSAAGTVTYSRLVTIIEYFSIYLGDQATSIRALLNALVSERVDDEMGRILRPLNDIIKLTAWEIQVKNISINIYPSVNKTIKYKNRTEKKKNSLKVTRNTFRFDKCTSNISNYICATEKCTGSIFALDKPYLVENANPRAIQISANNPGIHLICMDAIPLPINLMGAGNRDNNSTLFYFCRSSLILNNFINRTNNLITEPCVTRIHPTGAFASMKVLTNSTNHFEILGGIFILNGGDGDDIFDFPYSLTCGSVHGGAGDDTLKLNGYVSSDYELYVKSRTVKYKLFNDTEQIDCIFMQSIERIVGQLNRTETVFVDCAFDMIALNGGLRDRPDKILVAAELYCPETISIVVRGATLVSNIANRGRYLYKVTSLDEGNVVMSLEGTPFNYHTIIIEFATINDLKNIYYNNRIINIITKNDGLLSLNINGSHDSIRLIFKEGQNLYLNEGTLQIKENDAKYNLATLMSKYGSMNIMKNISLSIESERLGLDICLSKNKIQYGKDNPIVPFQFVHIVLDGGMLFIDCGPGVTYVLVTPDYISGQTFFPAKITTATFRYAGSQHETVHLIIDVTQFFAYTDGQQVKNVYHEIIDGSRMFKLTGTISYNGTYVTAFVLYFDGFAETGRLENFVILTPIAYRFRIKNFNGQTIENFGGYFPPATALGSAANIYQLSIINKRTKVYKHLVDCAAKFTRQDADFEELIFPMIHLINYDLIRIGNHIVMTSIRFNIDDDIRRQRRSFFTFIFENYFIDEKLRNLTLKFANGMIINTSQLSSPDNDFIDIKKFQFILLQMERYLTKRESESMEYMGDLLNHRWQEVKFGKQP